MNLGENICHTKSPPSGRLIITSKGKNKPNVTLQGESSKLKETMLTRKYHRQKITLLFILKASLNTKTKEAYNGMGTND